jgi:hypothetical protein
MTPPSSTTDKTCGKELLPTLTLTEHAFHGALHTSATRLAEERRASAFLGSHAAESDQGIHLV